MAESGAHFLCSDLHQLFRVCCRRTSLLHHTVSFSPSFPTALPPTSVTPALLPRSLKAPTPLYHLLGDLPVTHHKGQFLFTQKLFLVKVPSSPQAVFTLVGYLSSSSPLRQLLGTALQSTLEVWSDGSALRHMDSRQHLWISKLLVLGMTCLSDDDLTHLKPSE